MPESLGFLSIVSATMGRGRSETFLHEEDERGEKQQEQQQTHFITLVNNVIFFRFRFFFSRLRISILVLRFPDKIRKKGKIKEL